MPKTEPGAGRAYLGFEPAVEREFAFLSAHGLDRVVSESTFLRFESASRFVNVFHGRASYEIGVEVGRWIETGGELVEERYPLSYLAQVVESGDRLGVRGLTAVDAGQVERFVEECASWARDLVPHALGESSDRLFADMSDAVSRESDLLTQGDRANLLRTRARLAWQSEDFADVVLAYEEIRQELPLVELAASEKGRLDYARRHVQ